MDFLNGGTHLETAFCLIIILVIFPFSVAYRKCLLRKYQKTKKRMQIIYLLAKILRFGCVVRVEMDELSTDKARRPDEIIKFGGMSWIDLWWCEEINSYQILVRTVEKKPPPIVVDFGEKWRTIVLIPNEK